MTKEHLLAKTHYGLDIIQHLIRKEFPDQGRPPREVIGHFRLLQKCGGLFSASDV